jgi:hypothetical protein
MGIFKAFSIGCVICVATFFSPYTSAQGMVFDEHGVPVETGTPVAADPIPDGTKPPGSFFSNMTKAASIMKDKTDSVLTAGLLNAGFKSAQAINKWALTLGGSLALIYLIVESIGLLSGRNSSGIQVLFDVGLPVVLCSYLLLNYDMLMHEFAGKDGFLGYIRSLGGDPIASITNMYGSIFDMVTRAISQSCESFLKTVSVFKMGTTFLAFFDALITILFALGIVVLCLTGLTELIGLVLLGPFLGAIAIAFGPLFIAGLVTPWTREYFSKWLGFLVASAVLTGVLGVCTTIVSTLFTSFTFGTYASAEAPVAAHMLLVVVIIMSINSLVQQAPQIASAMVPGSLGASKGAGAAVREAARGAGDRAKGAATDAKNITSAARDRMNASKAAPTPEVAAAPLKYPTLNL